MHTVNFWDLKDEEVGPHEHCQLHCTSCEGSERLVRKMMTASQSTQLNADHGQEGTSADSKPGLSFTTHSQMSMQACAHAVATPVTLPQDCYIRTLIQCEQVTPIQHKQANFQAQHHELSNEED